MKTLQAAMLIATLAVLSGAANAADLLPAAAQLGSPATSAVGEVVSYGDAPQNGRIAVIVDETGGFDKDVFRATPVSGYGSGSQELIDGVARGQQLYPTLVSSEASMGSMALMLIVPGLPEPASWAMMMVGVGFIGGVLRRRSARVAAA